MLPPSKCTTATVQSLLDVRTAVLNDTLHGYTGR